MWGDVNNILGFGRDLPSGQFILLTNDDTSDISFLINSLLHHYLRKQGTVVFVHLVQSFSHYQTIASKCGISLKTNCESGNLICIDGLTFLRETLDAVQANCDGKPSETKENPLTLMVTKDNTDPSHEGQSLKPLYIKIKDAVDKKRSCGKDILVLIDDVSCLLGLGASLTEVYDFVHYCFALCYQSSEGSLRKGTLAVLSHSGGDFDEEYNKLESLMKIFSTVHISTKGLTTGYSKDIHGEITFTKMNFGIGLSDVTTMHYKVGDRGAKLFAKGTATGLM